MSPPRPEEAGKKAIPSKDEASSLKAVKYFYLKPWASLYQSSY